MTDSYSTLQRLDKLATLLDARWKLPGTDIRFGLDALIGMIPGIGDATTALISLYLMAEAKAAGASKKILGKMAFNVSLEFVIGLIPIIGDLFDIGWRANQRNMTLLRREISPPPPDIAGRRGYEHEANNEKANPRTSTKGWLILLTLMAVAAIAGNHYGWYRL